MTIMFELSMRPVGVLFTYATIRLMIHEEPARRAEKAHTDTTIRMEV